MKKSDLDLFKPVTHPDFKEHDAESNEKNYINNSGQKILIDNDSINNTKDYASIVFVEVKDENDVTYQVAINAKSFRVKGEIKWKPVPDCLFL